MTATEGGLRDYVQNEVGERVAKFAEAAMGSKGAAAAVDVDDALPDSSESGVQRKPQRDSVERIAARFAAAEPKWHRLYDELKRRYPNDGV